MIKIKWHQIWLGLHVTMSITIMMMVKTKLAVSFPFNQDQHLWRTTRGMSPNDNGDDVRQQLVLRIWHKSSDKNNLYDGFELCWNDEPWNRCQDHCFYPKIGVVLCCPTRTGHGGNTWLYNMIQLTTSLLTRASRVKLNPHVDNPRIQKKKQSTHSQSMSVDHLWSPSFNCREYHPFWQSKSRPSWYLAVKLSEGIRDLKPTRDSSQLVINVQ